MDWNAMFLINSIMLGAGLAMDAFSVSLANGLNNPGISKGKSLFIAAIFSFFQFLMPLLGWFCVTTMVNCFCCIEPFIPWIALILLCFIGSGMIRDGIKGGEEHQHKGLGLGILAVQGIATSIDALSVGFTISEYNALMAFFAALIIGIITLAICFTGVEVGKKFGNKIAGKSSIFGGTILILIGIEIVIASFF